MNISLILKIVKLLADSGLPELVLTEIHELIERIVEDCKNRNINEK